MEENYGNPSSLHRMGLEAEKAVKQARRELAEAAGKKDWQICFTSGGTESDNMAIFGAAKAGRRQGRRIVTTAVEHPAVLECCQMLSGEGFDIVRIGVDRQGRLDLAQAEEAIDGDTILVTMMQVNNEVGTIFPVDEIARIIREKKAPALLHCDAVQSFGKIPLPAHADLIAVSGHKIHGPKGSGALLIRKGLHLPAFIRGGGQEKGLRSGTEATPQIAAFAAAAEIGYAHRDENIAYLNDLKAYALETLRAKVPGLAVVSQGDAPHICAVSLPGRPSQVVVRYLSDKGFCLSAGSACHRGKASHVYGAMNLSKPVRDGMLRISFAPSNTREEVDALAEAMLSATQELVAAGR